MATWHNFCRRPYCAESTRSHPNSEVKLRKARSVLGWGTAWEALRVPLAFSVVVLDKLPLSFVVFCSVGLVKKVAIFVNCYDA